MLQSFGTSVVTGFTAFTATNLDDIVVLMLFFARVNASFRRRHIVVGQYLGFTILLLASLPGFLGGLVVPKMWLGLLGLLPIGIGGLHLFHLFRDDESHLSIQAAENPLMPGQPPLSKPNLTHPQTAIAALLASLLNPYTYEVTAVTLANGGDNIGIYVPLFASQNLIGLGVIVCVFYLLVGIWCFTAAWLTRHRPAAVLITRYGHAIVPFFLIGLGIFILVDSGALKHLLQRQGV